MDFSDRAKALRTPEQAKFYDAEEQERAFAKKGLSKEDYWKTVVKCRADAEVWYQLYYPEYPDVLVKALLDKIDTVMVACRADPSILEKLHIKKQEKLLAQGRDENMMNLGKLCYGKRPMQENKEEIKEDMVEIEQQMKSTDSPQITDIRTLFSGELLGETPPHLMHNEETSHDDTVTQAN